MRQYIVSMSVEVSDEQLLWDAASAYLAKQGTTPPEAEEIIGSRESPNASACLVLLLEPDEKPSGVEVGHTDATAVFWSGD